MIRALLVFILFGGVFFTTHLFQEFLNHPKSFFLLITTLILLLVSFMTKKGVEKLLDSLKTRSLYYGVAIICLFVTIHGFLQYYGLMPSYHKAFPITGTFENPAGFATVQAAMFPFVFSLCFNREYVFFMRLFSFTISLLCFASVILSGSRAGSIAIFSAIVVILAFTDTVSTFFKVHRWAWIPVLVIVASSLVVLYFVKQDSADGRIFIWGRCIEMIKEHPLFGYGTNGFHGNYMIAQAKYFRSHPYSPYVMIADNVTHPFNEYLKLTINYGIVGLLVGIILLVWIVRRLLKNDRQTKMLGLSFVVSVFVMCQFSYPFQYDVVWFLSFIALMPSFTNMGRKIVIPRYVRLIVSFLLLGGLAVSLRMMYYEMKWTEISNRAIKGRAGRMMPFYENVNYVLGNNPLFLYNYAAELNTVQRYEESLDVLTKCAQTWNEYNVQILYSDNYAKLGQYDNAIKACDEAYNMIPCRFGPLYRKMLIYSNSNDTINAILMANEILDKPIKVQSKEISQIRSAAEQLIIHFGDEW